MHTVRLLRLFASLILLGSIVPAAAAPPPLALSGRVLDDQGAALAGAEIALAPVPDPSERARLDLAGRAAPEPVARTRTGADGSYRLEAPQGGLYQVLVTARERVPMRLSPLAVVDELELEPVRLARDAGGSVQVVDSTGAPVAGVRVSAVADSGPRRDWDRSVKWRTAPQWGVTDAAGRVAYARSAQSDYQVAALSAQRPAVVREGLREKSTRLVLADGIAREVEIRSGAMPAAGAAVWLEKPRLALALADEAGRAIVPLPARGGLQVIASDALRGSVRARLRPLRGEEPERPQRLALERTRPIAGRVLDAETRAPIAGAIVYDVHGESGWTTTDARGYTLPLERGARPALAAAARGYLVDSAAAEVDLAAREAPTLALERVASIEGVVVDGAGNPVAGAEVWADPLRSTAPVFNRGDEPATVHAVSEARGGFRLRNLAASRDWLVAARHAGFGVGRVTVDDLAAGRRRGGVRITLPPEGQLVGRVIAGDESPIVGARLELKPAVGGDYRLRLLRARPGRDETPRAATAAEGRFAFAGLGPGRYDLTVEATGFAPTRIPQIEIVAGQGVDLGEIALDPGEVVAGRVVDRAGDPIGGAEILLDPRAALLGMEIPPAAVSGADGRFEIPDRRAGERLDLMVRKRGFGVVTRGGILVPPEQPLRIELPPLGRISGRVLDAQGRAAEATVGGIVAQRAQTGAMGAMMSSSTIEPVETDSEGRFEIAGVAAGQVLLQAEGPAGERAATEELELAPGGALEGVELRFASGVRLVGRVSDPEGGPARDALVEVQGASALSGPGSSAITDGDGRFTLQVAAAGRVSVSAEKHPYRRAVREVEIGAADGELQVDLQLGSGLAVRGFVVDDQGAPAADAFVSLDSAGGGGGRFRRSGVSNSEGAFEIDGVEPGSFRIVAEKAGFRRAELPEPLVVEALDAEGVLLRLGRGGAIFGHVTGLAFDDLADVRISARATADSAAAAPDYEGAYRLDGLGPGDWTVVAELQRAGRRAQGRTTLGDPPGEVELDLEFGRGLTLAGSVLWRGEPVVGGWVSAVGGPAPEPASAQTDGEGRFRIEGLTEGTYLVRASEPSGVAWALEEVHLDADRVLRLELASATIEGEVRDARDQKPIRGAQVRVEPASGEPLPNLRISVGGGGTGDDGFFRREGVGLGEQRVLASAEGYAAAERRVSIVDRDQVARVDFRLEPNEGVTLHVLGPAGTPPERVWAAALDASGSAIWSDFVMPGEEGRLALTSLPPGEWTLLVGSWDLPVVRLRVTSPGDAGEVRLPAPGRLRAQVPSLAEGTMSRVRLIGVDGQPYVRPYGVQPRADYRMSGREISIGSLPPGPWRIEVKAADGRILVGDATVVANAEVAVEIE